MLALVAYIYRVKEGVSCIKRGPYIFTVQAKTAFKNYQGCCIVFINVVFDLRKFLLAVESYQRKSTDFLQFIGGLVRS